ncbi:MAG: phage tail tape measure protein [Caulobacterales bacterium]|jgi:hypothetical protein|nr:phage tail tape measure protein [Caulobacterales bacterium]
MNTEKMENLSRFEAELASAAAALQAFARGPAQSAADEVGASFERAGERIARALSGAAMGGENAFKRMAKVILEELAKIALQRLFTQGDGKPSFFGARAGGGAVNVGGAYLVGERGPELFVPRQAGEIAAAQAGAVSVHFHIGGGDANAIAIARHQGQIAAAVARAVAYGRRNL